MVFHSLKSFLFTVVLVGVSSKVYAFDANECTAFVFRTNENALWHCGDRLPGVPAAYCDHNGGFAYSAADRQDEWCDFMVSTVKANHYPLTTNINVLETPGPNKYQLHTLVDWGCYIVENGAVKASYKVNTQSHETAAMVTEQCARSDAFNYFDDSENDKKLGWGDWSRREQLFGHITDTNYIPTQNVWENCHYDDTMRAPAYSDNLSERPLETIECKPGFICIQAKEGLDLCMPDSKADNKCCISWAHKCSKVGECCAGSECNAEGFCEVVSNSENSIQQVHEYPPGIENCQEDRGQEKVEKALWNTCYDPVGNDCAPGYKCKAGSWVSADDPNDPDKLLYANCVIDHEYQNSCATCKYNYDGSNPRPGDCCDGWYAHCNTYDANSSRCIASQCLPGRETGSSESGESMMDVHDRICTDPPPLASWNEAIDKCVGAVCGVWGDPHIITCDELHYDCMAVGLFTLMRNQMFNIEAHFLYLETPWGGASVTNDVAIDYLPDNGEVPTFQFSFPEFVEENETYHPSSRQIGACPILFYVDGDLQDISGVADDGYLWGNADSDHHVRLAGQPNEIQIQHAVGTYPNGEPYYSNSVIWVDGSGPHTDWSCILTFFTCLPRAEEDDFVNRTVGLLGSPDGNSLNDWMTTAGDAIAIPEAWENMGEQSFDYCVNNWCIPDEDVSIMTYPPGQSFNTYSCPGNQTYDPFNVTDCDNWEWIVEQCEDRPTPAKVESCQIELCIGNPNPTPDDDLIPVGDDDDIGPPVPPTEDDCTNLGAGLSKASGVSGFSENFPPIQTTGAEPFTQGRDGSLSLLVGGNFVCENGSGFEGNAVVMGDFTVERNGCPSMAITPHGSKVHPMIASHCIQVGGGVDMTADIMDQKFIMWESGVTSTECHLVYKDSCTLNGGSCSNPNDQYVNTHGDIAQVTDLDMTRWDDELVLLQQKTEYWNTLEANGQTSSSDGYFNFGTVDNSMVQVYDIDASDLSGAANVLFEKELYQKTILIRVTGSADFNVPNFCYHPENAMPGDNPFCGTDSFPTAMTASILWLFDASDITFTGDGVLQGSVLLPNGSLTLKNKGHAGRLIVGKDLTISGDSTELYNYPFDPLVPLPLPANGEEICTIPPPAPCVEDYKVRTGDSVCPDDNQIVKLLHSSHGAPPQDVIYDIAFDSDDETVKFKIDNPFVNATDIFVKHVKKVGEFALDPKCESLPNTAGCLRESELIEVGCHSYDGVAPFALVNVYFASSSDAFVINAPGDVEVDKCCKPPEDYLNDGFGVIEYTFEIQCTCPSSSIS